MEKNIRKILMVVLVITIAVGFRFLFEYLFNLIWNLYDLSSVSGYFIRGFFVMIFALVWLSIALRSENPHQKLPWLLLLALEPATGLVLFLTFGRNFKRTRRYRRRPKMHGDAYITREMKPEEAEIWLKGRDQRLQDIFHAAHHLSHHQPFVDNTHIEVLKNGEEFYPDLRQAILAAEKFILLEFFIVRSDARGREIVDLLIAKAAEGIEVKMIIDGLGSARIGRRYLKKIRRSKIDFLFNDRIYFPLFNTRVNYRNHRKIVVVDGLTAYTGGMNIANEYDNTAAHPFYFRDTQLKIRGALVQSLTALFFKDYYYNTGRFVDDDSYYPKTEVPAEGIVQVVQSGPDSSTAAIRNLYLKLIFSARKSIKIMTPYMALDQETLTVLQSAAKSGIDVEIIIPGVPDKYLVYKVTKSFVTSLVKEDIKIYQYEKGFCHAKVFIIDDEIASVGSYNLDNRSAVIDFEVTVLMANPTVADIVKDFSADKKDSRLIDAELWQKRNVFVRLLEGVMSIFSPII